MVTSLRDLATLGLNVVMGDSEDWGCDGWAKKGLACARLIIKVADMRRQDETDADTAENERIKMNWRRQAGKRRMEGEERRKKLADAAMSILLLLKLMVDDDE